MVALQGAPWENIVVAAPCNGAPTSVLTATLPATAMPSMTLTPRAVRVSTAIPTEPTSTPRLYMSAAYPPYAAGQVIPQVQPQVLRFHSVGHTGHLG
eukprot:Skav222637  [mRNA]  locus=scaffold10:244417:259896:- [translate_table: standard]